MSLRLFSQRNNVVLKTGKEEITRVKRKNGGKESGQREERKEKHLIEKPNSNLLWMIIQWSFREFLNTPPPPHSSLVWNHDLIGVINICVISGSVSPTMDESALEMYSCCPIPVWVKRPKLWPAKLYQQQCLLEHSGHARGDFGSSLDCECPPKVQASKAWSPEWYGAWCCGLRKPGSWGRSVPTFSAI